MINLKAYSRFVIGFVFFSILFYLFTTTVQAEEEKKVIIKYNKTIKDNKKKHIKDSLKLKYLKNINEQIEILSVDDKSNVSDVIDALGKDPDVEYIQADYELELYGESIKDEFFPFQWNLLNIGQEIVGQKGKEGVDMNFLEVSNITNRNKNILIGILDTGIDISHEDLEKSIFINHREIPGNGIDDDKNGYIDDVFGWDFHNNINKVYRSLPLDIHGTHIAGIIGAQSNKIGIRGLAPKTKLVPLRFIEGSKGSTSDAIEAIEYAKSLGVKIINCSWGGKEYNKALYDVMKNSDMLFVCASGNEGKDTSLEPSYPASFDLPNVISVAAIDNKGGLFELSNYGSNIHIAAPGVNIPSTIPENGYYMLSGTSMAAPHVSAIAALILTIDNKFPIKNIKSVILNNSKQIESLKGKVSSGGIVDMSKTLRSVNKN